MNVSPLDEIPTADYQSGCHLGRRTVVMMFIKFGYSRGDVE
jgi:hypothetical protein